MSNTRVRMDKSKFNKELTVIEYPGNVQNIDNMVKTLGGLVNISQVFSGEQKRMELRFQPDNHFCKCVSGDVRQNAGLLLKVRIRRSKKHPEKPSTCFIEVLGHSKKSFGFGSLADYQYLPVTKNAETGRGEFILEDIIPKDVVDISYFSRTSAPGLCIPYQFARSDTVHTNIHKIDLKDDGQSEILGVLQKPIYDSREVIPFSLTDPFPIRPDPAVAKRMRIKYVSDEQLLKVKKLFEEIPCWTRFALLYESGITPDKLKHITPSVSYLFSNGPWRTMYVRYGYDPRKDFSSRYYQTFDLRVSYRTGMAEFLNVQRPSGKAQEKERSISEPLLVQGNDYPYLEEGKLPRSRQWILRYCDLKINKIKEMLDKIPSPLAGATCNEKTGWLPPGFDAQVRQIINNSFKETMREYYRKRNLQDKTTEEDEYITDDDEPDKDSDEYDEGTEEELDMDMDCVKLEHMQMEEDNDGDL